MKSLLITLFAISCISIISCKKNEKNTIKTTAGTLIVDYDGNSYSFDSVYFVIKAQNADSTITQLRIYGVDLNSNPSTGTFLQFDCFPAVGSENYTTYWNFDFGIHCRLNSSLITDNNSKYIVNITSNLNKKFSGNFSCSVGTKTLSGTFNDVHVK
ncbi:MAG TPA: hypothetical protein PLL99_01850 [Chitinophagales bacterium]|jgi:hypothetical protein|nr:hypothetical protein [Chitinophagales bacterium]